MNDDDDYGLRKSLRRRCVRRWVVMAAVTGLFLEFGGLPHVRLGDEKRGYSYWSVTGECSVRFNRGHAPLIVLQPLDRSLLDYGRTAISGLWERGQALAKEIGS